MNLVDMHVVGGDALVATLRRLGSEIAVPAQQRALLVAAEPMRATAASLAPRGHGAGPHLADDIVMQPISTSRIDRSEDLFDVDAAVAMGPSHRPQDHFYGFFQEFGTVFHAAHPFMRPAFDGGVAGAVRILADQLWAAIRKLLPTGGLGGGFGSRAA